jgi:hypothetical protein
MCTGGPFLAGNAAGIDADHSLPFGAEVKKEWSYTSSALSKRLNGVPLWDSCTFIYGYTIHVGIGQILLTCFTESTKW